jgi:hypothetical protein
MGIHNIHEEMAAMGSIRTAVNLAQWCENEAGGSFTLRGDLVNRVATVRVPPTLKASPLHAQMRLPYG